jgi:hypothetical protein
LGKEEEIDEHLNVFNPPCYDTDTDIVDIDEFIHVGRRRWDVIGYDMDPIYDIESHSKCCLYNYHTDYLLTSGNKEMIFLPMLPKHPRLT